MLHMSRFRRRPHAVIHRKSTRIGDAHERHQKIRGARTWGLQEAPLEAGTCVASVL